MRSGLSAAVVFPLLAFPSQRTGYRLLQLVASVLDESLLTLNERESLLEAGLRRIVGIQRHRYFETCRRWRVSREHNH